MCRRKAFGLIDVIFTIVISLLAMAVILPTLMSAREVAKRSFCLENLSDIGQAISMYVNANEQCPGLGRVAGVDKTTPSAAMVTESNTDVMTGDTAYNANGYALLVYRGYANYKMFICPSTMDIAQTQPKANTQFGFDSTDGSDVSYGFQPYNGATGIKSTPSGGKAASIALGAAGMSGPTVIAADKKLSANSVTVNHGTLTEGSSNFLMFSGEVKSEKWSTTPTQATIGSWGSATGDNPWANDGNVGAGDSYSVFTGTK